jgi:hypothetical protein
LNSATTTIEHQFDELYSCSANFATRCTSHQTVLDLLRLLVQS